MSRRKTIRPSVEAGPAKLLVLLLCSWPAPPLAELSPPQAANNSTEQSPMRRPITSPTRRDGFPISEWYMPLLLLSSLIAVCVAEMLTLGAPLSREVGDCFLSWLGIFSRDIFLWWLEGSSGPLL